MPRYLRLLIPERNTMNHTDWAELRGVLLDIVDITRRPGQTLDDIEAMLEAKKRGDEILHSKKED